MQISWPGGHKFAFTAVDDTDWSTVPNTRPVYDLLASLGMRTTKSVWIFDGRDSAGYQGQTCEDTDYLRWIECLLQCGFEISLHNAAPVTSRRDRIHAALNRFSELFGRRMLMHCNHRACADNLYWGDHRLSGVRRYLYNRLTRGRRSARFRGHLPGDPHFWGDLCQNRVSYIRNFVFDEINTLTACPEMPYFDPAKPFVNSWFASSEGGSLHRFLRTYSYENIERLVSENGLSIACVHFGSNFVHEGQVHPEFRRRLEFLARHDGWFATASTILDFLRRGRPREHLAIPAQRLARIEARWLAGKVVQRLCHRA